MAVLCPHLHSFFFHVLKKQDNKRFWRGQLLANPMLAPPHAKSTGIGPASSVVTNQSSEASLASASSKLTAQLSLLYISDIYILYVASFYVLASYVNLFCVYFLKEKHIHTLALCYMRLRQATGRGGVSGAPHGCS